MYSVEKVSIQADKQLAIHSFNHMQMYTFNCIEIRKLK